MLRYMLLRRRTNNVDLKVVLSGPLKAVSGRVTWSETYYSFSI